MPVAGVKAGWDRTRTVRGGPGKRCLGARRAIRVLPSTAVSREEPADRFSIGASGDYLCGSVPGARTAPTADAHFLDPHSQPILRDPLVTIGSVPPSRSTAALLSILILGVLAPQQGHTQGVEGLISPRGTLMVDFFPSTRAFGSGFGPDGTREGLGAPFAAEALGSEMLPQLEPFEDALRELSEAPNARFRLGTTRATVRGYESRFPIRVAWGITDRITVGAMVPIVRRRVEAGITFAPLDGNVGANPFLADPEALDGFVSSVSEALTRAEGRVDALCAEEGEDSTACREGRELLGSGEEFLTGLPGAFEGSPLAPMQESPLGQALLQRVDGLRTGIEELGEAPFEGTLPLPSDPLEETEFRELFLSPVYGSDRPPADSWPGIPELGDVEFHVTGLLVDREFGSNNDDRTSPSLRLQTAGMVVLQLGTQQPDTLREHFEGQRPQGHTAVRVRLANELGIREWLGLGLHLELQQSESDQVRRRVAPADDPFDPERERVPVRWNPGRTVGVEVVPRVRLTPELSLGARYRYFARGPDEYEAVEGSVSGADPQVLAPAGNVRSQYLGAELSYSTMERAEEGLVFPFLVRMRLERAFSGRGGRVPADTRVEAGFRVFLRP